jgi:hypothetical protein
MGKLGMFYVKLSILSLILAIKFALLCTTVENDFVQGVFGLLSIIGVGGFVAASIISVIVYTENNTK